jgi:hypothetical protein
MVEKKVMGPASYFPSIEKKYGKSIEHWMKELPVEISINVFAAVRASSLEILKRLTPEQLNNSGIHSESGEYSINTWLATYIKHPSEHAEQLGI